MFSETRFGGGGGGGPVIQGLCVLRDVFIFSPALILSFLFFLSVVFVFGVCPPMYVQLGSIFGTLCHPLPCMSSGRRILLFFSGGRGAM